MKLAVFGPTGATGEQILRRALAAGHDVTASGRYSDRLASPTGGYRTAVDAPLSRARTVSRADLAAAMLAAAQDPTLVHRAVTIAA